MLLAVHGIRSDQFLSDVVCDRDVQRTGWQ